MDLRLLRGRIRDASLWMEQTMFTFVSVSYRLFLSVLLQTHLLCFPTVFLRVYLLLVFFSRHGPCPPIPPRPSFLSCLPSFLLLYLPPSTSSRPLHPFVSAAFTRSFSISPGSWQHSPDSHKYPTSPDPHFKPRTPPEGFDLWWRSVTGVCPPPPPHLPLKKRGRKTNCVTPFGDFYGCSLTGCTFMWLHVCPCVASVTAGDPWGVGGGLSEVFFKQLKWKKWKGFKFHSFLTSFVVFFQ